MAAWQSRAARILCKLMFDVDVAPWSVPWLDTLLLHCDFRFGSTLPCYPGARHPVRKRIRDGAPVGFRFRPGDPKRAIGEARQPLGRGFVGPGRDAEAAPIRHLVHDKWHGGMFTGPIAGPLMVASSPGRTLIIGCRRSEGNPTDGRTSVAIYRSHPTC